MDRAASGCWNACFRSGAERLFVLILLGFATTDFVITMTLSAADAAAHVVHNPFTPDWMKSQMGVTLVLLGILGAIFLKGFSEAIGVAVVLVATYLSLERGGDRGGHSRGASAPAYPGELEGCSVRATRKSAGDARHLADLVPQTRAGTFRLRDRAWP